MRYRDTYDELLDTLLYHFNPCKIQQLQIALMKCFSELDERQAQDILYRYQAHGQVLLSDDGWAITKRKYVEITRDSRYIKSNPYHQNRLGFMDYVIENQCDLRLVDCLWVMLDFLPDSLEFSTMNKPFQMTFLHKDKMVQVIYIKAEDEDRKIEMMKLLPTPSEYTDKKTGMKYSLKSNLIRIAIMENETHGWKIPDGIGFKYICAMDEKEKKKFKVVEKRANAKVW